MTFSQLIGKFNYSLRAYEILFALSRKIKNKSDYITWGNEKIDIDVTEYTKIFNSNKPIERITGKVIFWKKEFILHPKVFCPRHETEKIIEEFKKETNISGSYIDICSGSGIIGITIALNYPQLQVSLLDIDKHAIENILLNIKKYKIKANVIQDDWLKHLEQNKYEIITANFPYIGFRDQIEEHLIQNEPRIALFSECEDGWKHYNKLIEWLKKNKYWKLIFLECNSNHEDIWKKIISENKKFNFETVRDDRNLLRIVKITR